MRRRVKSRQRYAVQAFLVGLALAGEIHLFSAEILHHHDAVVAICRFAHDGASHLHASQEVSLVCPLCQIVRSGSVRPAVRSLFQKLCQGASYHLIACTARYSSGIAPTLPARSPPLS